MIFNLDNELSTIKAFLKHGASIVSMEMASESDRLNRFGRPNEEFIEDVVTSPDGSNALKNIICRSVINELNSLCEFALQITWIELSGSQLNLPNGSLIFTAKRGDIEKFLSDSKYLGDKSTFVHLWPSWPKVKEIKELSEGFKHRQRLQPFPLEIQAPRTPTWMTERLIAPENKDYISEYELTISMVSDYIDAVEILFNWLKLNKMLWMTS